MIKIGIDNSWAHGGVRFYVLERVPGGRHPFKITIEKLPAIGSMVRMEPSLEVEPILAEEMIRALIEALQEKDLLPKVTATESELKATHYHLEDMRKLVFEANETQTHPIK